MQRVRLPLVDMRVDGHALRKLRTDARITQKQLAERAEISEHWLRAIELHDQQPSLPVAEDIAKGLACPLAAFCIPTDTARPRRRRKTRVSDTDDQVAA